MSIHVPLSMMLITAFFVVCAAGQSKEFSTCCQSNATQKDIENVKEEDSQITTPIIVAAIGCFIVVVAITLTAVACIRRRKHGGHSVHKEIPSGSDLSERRSVGQSVLSDDGTYIELNDASYAEPTSRDSLHPYSNEVVTSPRNPQGKGISTADSQISKHIAERPSVDPERLSKLHVYVNVPREDHLYINCETQPQRQESLNSQHTYDYPYQS